MDCIGDTWLRATKIRYRGCDRCPGQRLDPSIDPCINVRSVAPLVRRWTPRISDTMDEHHPAKISHFIDRVVFKWDMLVRPPHPLAAVCRATLREEHHQLIWALSRQTSIQMLRPPLLICKLASVREFGQRELAVARLRAPEHQRRDRVAEFCTSGIMFQWKIITPLFPIENSSKNLTSARRRSVPTRSPGSRDAVALVATPPSTWSHITRSRGLVRMHRAEPLAFAVKRLGNQVSASSGSGRFASAGHKRKNG